MAAGPVGGYVGQQARYDPASVFYRYNIEIEMMALGREVILRYKGSCRKIDREVFEDCLRDPKRAEYLARMIHEEWEESERRKYQATVPPLGWSNEASFPKPATKVAPKEAPTLEADVARREKRKKVLLLEDLP